MLRVKLALLVLLVVLAANAVCADCMYNGTKYPENSVVGPYICRNGQWVSR